MTNFNDLLLAEKLTQAKRGDIVVTDSGSRCVFYDGYNDSRTIVALTKIRNHILDNTEITDIIRPEPEAKPVPEIVRTLQKIACRCNGLSTVNDVGHRLTDICNAFAKHFEKESQK